MPGTRFVTTRTAPLRRAAAGGPLRRVQAPLVIATAQLVAAGIALLNLAITIAAIRVRRTDLTGAQHPVTAEPAEQTPQIRSM